MLDISSFITRTALDRFAILYINSQSDFVTENVLTPMPVPKTATKKYQYDTSMLREVPDEKPSKAKANKVDYGVFTSNLTTTPHALAADIDPQDERNADAPVADMEQKQATNILSRLMIRRERLMVTKVSTAGNYPSGLTAAAGATWSSIAGDPEGDVLTMKKAVRDQCSAVPNALAVSWEGLERLKQSPALKARLMYTSGQRLTEEEIKNLLGVQYLTVAKAKYDSSLPGGTVGTLTDIWSNFALCYVYEPNPQKESIRYGHFYVRNQLYNYSYVDNERGSGDGRIKVLEMGWDYSLDAAAVESSSSSKFSAGYLLTGIY